jgi:hypothetical protein
MKLSPSDSVHGSFISSDSATLRRFVHGFPAPAATTSGSWNSTRSSTTSSAGGSGIRVTTRST